MRVKPLLLFFVSLVFFVKGCVCAHASDDIVFQDDFSSPSLDIDKWEYFNNGGNVLLDGNEIKLSSSPRNNFPYIRSRNNPFPENGDFTLEFRAKFPSVTPWGVGLLLCSSQVANLVPYDDPINSRIFTYHADTSKSTFWFRFLLDYYLTNPAIDLYAKLDNEYHVVNVVFDSSAYVYKYYIDGHEIFTSVTSSIRPTMLFFGSPHNQVEHIPDDTNWSSITVDYIKTYNYLKIPVVTTPISTATVTPTPTVAPTSTPALTPTPTPAPVAGGSPVVFIPGHGGSFNWEDMLFNTDSHTWGQAPLVFDQVYGLLLKTFRKYDYKESNGKLYVFYYNWLRKTGESSDKLDSFIGNILNSKPPNTKVWVVAHSYGGIVAKNYIRKYGEKHNNREAPVEKILTVASPHEGTVDSYGAWEGGEVWRDDVLSKTAFETFIALHLPRYLTRKDTIRNVAPSTLDLFPIFDFLKKGNGEDIHINEMSVKNDFLKDNKNWLNNHPAIKNYYLLSNGINKETLESLEVKNRSWIDKILGYWEDGVPDEKNKTNNGDGGVLAKSAKIDGVSNIKESDLSHVELVSTKEGIKNIFNILGLSEPIFDEQENPIINKVLVFFLHSPARLRVTDFNGKEVGFNANAPFIPLSGSDGENQYIIIGNPEAGKYKVEVIGTEKGFYKLFVGTLNKDKTYFENFGGESYKNSNGKFVFSLDQSGEVSLEDGAKTAYLLDAKNKLKNLKEDISNQKFSLSAKRIFEIQINLEIKTIDKLIILIKTKDRRRIKNTTEDLINLMFGAKATVTGFVDEDSDSYLKIKSQMMDIIFDLEGAFGQFDEMVTRQQAEEIIGRGERIKNITSLKLEKLSNKRDIKEPISIFVEADNLLKEANNNFSLQELNKAYIKAYVSNLLFGEAIALSFF